jgi:hypothetical protein
MPAEEITNRPDAGDESSAGTAPQLESSEAEMWSAELAFIAGRDSMVRSAQFAIRTAVRAQSLALLAGTDAVDELLDAWMKATGAVPRRIYQTAITYLRTDQVLTTALRPHAR